MYPIYIYVHISIKRFEKEYKSTHTHQLKMFQNNIHEKNLPYSESMTK